MTTSMTTLAFPGNTSQFGTSRRLATVVAACLTLSACATTVTSNGASSASDRTTPVADPAVDDRSATPERDTQPPVSTQPGTTVDELVGPTTTAAPTTTTMPPTSTTSTTAPLDVFDAACVVRVGPLETLQSTAVTMGSADVVGLWAENGFVDSVAADDLVDVCVGNGLDDITGQKRPVLDQQAVAAASRANVERQQTKLNELFAGLGTTPLAVDGVSGAYTGQRLCASRVALGLDPSVDDMQPGSDEQAVLFTATGLPTPPTAATGSDRWAIIDRTCQMMFIGSGPDLVYVFPTSTGSAGFETRDQDQARAFRFNPAIDNGGWHNSSEFPVGVDNPLNGNLYKPLYFDLGQAIHGANNVPPTPQSKGCARLTIADQTTLLTWLGLIDATAETWIRSEINFTVVVQGEFVGR